MVNRSMGFTTNMLQLGHEINLQVDVLYGMPAVKEFFYSATGYLKSLLSHFREVHAEARAYLRGAQRCQKKLNDVSARVRAFNVGDLVYQRNVAVKLGQSRKLCPLFKGPYLIIRVLSPYLYKVQDRKKTLVLHHDLLKICEERAVPFWVWRKRHQLFQKEDIEEDRAQHWDEDTAATEEEEVVEVQVEDPGEMSAMVVDEEDRSELANSDPDIRGLDADMSHSGFPVEEHGRNSDLEETLPYSI